MLLPLLSEKDPVASTEGTLDPLGLFPTADSLANKLVPGVRERQSHPRFLTAMAVSLAVCSEFDEDRVAADGVSEPWQVFEWYMVEGLVRTANGDNGIVGLSGRDKAAQAIKDDVPLCANRYLKTPNVFGFHGVYRVLAREVGIDFNGRLGEFGYELLRVWMGEQGLKGFYGSDDGEGKKIRGVFKDAVKDGLEQGSVARSGGWSGWKLFRQYLAHLEPGRREADVIVKALRGNSRGHTQQILDFLVSPEGKKLWQEAPSEREIHKKLLPVSSYELNQYLQTIIKYETFSRLLQDAFDDCLFCMSRTRQKTKLKEFTGLKGVSKAHPHIGGLYSELVEMLAHYGEAGRFSAVFTDIAEKMDREQWVSSLLEHHGKIQQKKPPNGKAPWFERFDDGAYIIRPGYVRQGGGEYTDEYVHAYRLNPLWSFAKDLHLVN